MGDHTKVTKESTKASSHKVYLGIIGTPSSKFFGVCCSMRMTILITLMYIFYNLQMYRLHMCPSRRRASFLMWLRGDETWCTIMNHTQGDYDAKQEIVRRRWLFDGGHVSMCCVRREVHTWSSYASDGLDRVPCTIFATVICGHTVIRPMLTTVIKTYLTMLYNICLLYQQLAMVSYVPGVFSPPWEIVSRGGTDTCSSNRCSVQFKPKIHDWEIKGDVFRDVYRCNYETCDDNVNTMYPSLYDTCLIIALPSVNSCRRYETNIPYRTLLNAYKVNSSTMFITLYLLYDGIMRHLFLVSNIMLGIMYMCTTFHLAVHSSAIQSNHVHLPGIHAYCNVHMMQSRDTQFFLFISLQQKWTPYSCATTAPIGSDDAIPDVRHVRVSDNHPTGEGWNGAKSIIRHPNLVSHVTWRHLCYPASGVMSICSNDLSLFRSNRETTSDTCGSVDLTNCHTPTASTGHLCMEDNKWNIVFSQAGRVNRGYASTNNGCICSLNVHCAWWENIRFHFSIEGDCIGHGSLDDHVSCTPSMLLHYGEDIVRKLMWYYDLMSCKSICMYYVKMWYVYSTRFHDSTEGDWIGHEPHDGHVSLAPSVLPHYCGGIVRKLALVCDRCEYIYWGMFHTPFCGVFGTEFHISMKGDCIGHASSPDHVSLAPSMLLHFVGETVRKSVITYGRYMGIVYVRVYDDRIGVPAPRFQDRMEGDWIGHVSLIDHVSLAPSMLPLQREGFVRKLGCVGSFDILHCSNLHSESNDYCLLRTPLCSIYGTGFHISMKGDWIGLASFDHVSLAPCMLLHSSGEIVRKPVSMFGEFTGTYSVCVYDDNSGVVTSRFQYSMEGDWIWHVSLFGHVSLAPSMLLLHGEGFVRKLGCGGLYSCPHSRNTHSDFIDPRTIDILMRDGCHLMGSGGLYRMEGSDKFSQRTKICQVHKKILK